MATRPIERDEYSQIMTLLLNGFKYRDKNEVKKIFRSNKQIALVLQLQASLGLRIGDVLELKVSNFKRGKLETREEKINKTQYRDIHAVVYNTIMDYILENKLDKTDKLFTIGVRAVQKQLKIISKYLGLENISTHSFRKLFATSIYENNNRNLERVKDLLNHTSIITTRRYIGVSQEAINTASVAVNFIDNIKEAGI